MDPYAGEIRIFAGTFAPEGWLICNGQPLAISSNAVLYSLLGTTYGGDGVNTFNLPDLRGSAPLGLGTGAGLSTYVLGSKGGSATITLDSTQLAGHTHGLTANTAATGSGNAPAGKVLGVASAAYYTQTSASSPTFETLAGATVLPSGGGLPHDNSMPSLALNYIIATAGLYPPHG